MSTVTHNRNRPKRYWRNVRASWRDTILLLREFSWSLFFFVAVMVGAGMAYFWLSVRAGQPEDSLVESIYLVLGLTFLQPAGEFPDYWYLQVFYFIMPVIGIGILARGAADFGRLFFNRQSRSKEWEMAVASTFNNHVVLIGLGHLGFRVARELHDIDWEVVVIELDPTADLIAAAQEMEIPIIADDGKRVEALVGAGVARADAIVICTQNDNLNLQIAFKARKLNPEIHVVIRIFDDEFARDLEEQFGFKALSATRMAAPKFAVSAVGVDITRPITVEGHPLSLARLDVLADSQLIGMSVGEIEDTFEVSIVLLQRATGSDYHPSGDRVIAIDDVLALFGGPGPINNLVAQNRPH
jgi:voltage-gated potassium channel